MLVIIFMDNGCVDGNEDDGDDEEDGDGDDDDKKL